MPNFWLEKNGLMFDCCWVFFLCSVVTANGEYNTHLLLNIVKFKPVKIWAKNIVHIICNRIMKEIKHPCCITLCAFRCIIKRLRLKFCFLILKKKLPLS